MALDPERWFIIVPQMLGNGLSSSPSNTPPPYDRARFPRISVRDHVESQYRLFTEVFGAAGDASESVAGRAPADLRAELGRAVG